jgi:cytidine deaminase
MLNELEEKLLEEAEHAMERSYSPYSNFKVGAAVLSADGRMVSGTNYENASYGCTICAEGVAVTRANVEGIDDIISIAIIGSSDELVTPCGACRQVLSEASFRCNRDLSVIMSSCDKREVVKMKLSDLLPLSFSLDKEDIGERGGKF